MGYSVYIKTNAKLIEIIKTELDEICSQNPQWCKGLRLTDDPSYSNKKHKYKYGFDYPSGIDGVKHTFAYCVLYWVALKYNILTVVYDGNETFKCVPPNQSIEQAIKRLNIFNMFDKKEYKRMLKMFKTLNLKDKK